MYKITVKDNDKVIYDYPYAGWAELYYFFRKEMELLLEEYPNATVTISNVLP